MKDIKTREIAYFEKGRIENEKFWLRFGGKPDLKGKKILDLGCGHGSLCLDLIESGADEVLGLDLSPKLIAFANSYTRQWAEGFSGKLHFRCLNLSDLEEYNFDIIVSKAAFEHIADPADTLKEIKIRLKAGGHCYVGFGPLYHSPLGDHGIIRSIWGFSVPWAHVLLSDSFLIRKLNLNRKLQLKSISELGLNRIRYREFRLIFQKSGLVIRYFRKNVSANLLGRLINLFSSIPFLSNYLVFNVYCILEK